MIIIIFTNANSLGTLILDLLYCQRVGLLISFSSDRKIAHIELIVNYVRLLDIIMVH